MDIVLLLRSGWKRHLGSTCALIMLSLCISCGLATVLGLRASAHSYERSELDRMGYGDVTLWLSGNEQPEQVADRLKQHPQVGAVGIQPLFYANYQAHGQHSDTPGQLLTYQPDLYPYRLFRANSHDYQLNPVHLQPGQTLVSPAMRSMFNLNIGDTVYFSIVRGQHAVPLTVVGYFEDPIMGASVIGMKAFLISSEQASQLSQVCQEAGTEALAQPGAMLHVVQQSAGSNVSETDFNKLLNQQHQTRSQIKYVHTKSSIAAFMLVLHDAFSGFFLLLILILTLISLVVLWHSIEADLEQDRATMGLYKSLGISTTRLQVIQLLQQFGPILLGLIAGIPLSRWTSLLVSSATLPATSLFIAPRFPLLPYCVAILVIVCVFALAILFKTSRLKNISALDALHIADLQSSQSTQSYFTAAGKQTQFPRLNGHRLLSSLAARDLITGRRWYLSTFLVTLLLALLASMVLRMSVWLGPQGQGMMNAFNPAALDIGAQCLGSCDMQQVESEVRQISPIVDSYDLAMPTVSASGVDVTANVISQPSRLHILQGRTIHNPQEIVITEVEVQDLGLSLGQRITIQGPSGQDSFQIVGIYQCANDMGQNLGMSVHGYERIGEINPHMWCHHMFLADSSRAQEVIARLNSHFGSDIYTHLASWPGLISITAATEALVVVMSLVTIAVISLAIFLSGSKILHRQEHDLASLHLVGLSSRQLRISFTLRFIFVSFAAALIGTFVAGAVSNPILATLLQTYGIADFSSQPAIWLTCLPAAAITALAAASAYVLSQRIRSMSIYQLGHSL